MRIISPANPSTVYSDSLRLEVDFEASEVSPLSNSLWLESSQSGDRVNLQFSFSENSSKGPVLLDLDLSSQLPDGFDSNGSLNLYLEGQDGQTSNRLNLAIKPVSEREVPFGGFIVPCSSFFGAKYLVLSAWAVESGSKLVSAEFEIGGRKIPAKRIGLASQSVARGLPGLPEAENAIFSSLVVLGSLGLDRKRPQALAARAKFCSGTELEIPGKTISINSGYRESDSLIESFFLDDSRNLVLRGYIFSRETDFPKISFQSSGRTTTCDSIEWSKREDINWKHLGALERDSYAFEAKVSLDKIGRPPSLLKVIASYRDSQVVEPVGKMVSWRDLGGFCRDNWPLNVSGVVKSSAVWLRDKSLEVKETLEVLLSSDQGIKEGTTRENTQPPTRLTFVSHNLSDSQGAPRVLWQIVASLVQEEVEASRIRVIAADGGGLKEKLEALGVQVLLFPKLSMASLDWSDYFSCLEEVKPHLADSLVLANTVDCFWALDAAQSLGLESISCLHENLYPEEVMSERSPQLRLRCLEVLSKTPLVTFVSERSRECLSEILSDTETSVIPNGIDISRWDELLDEVDREKERAALALSPEDKVVLCLGTICHRKGQDVLLEAFSALKVKNLKLILVGGLEDAFSASLSLRANELGLSDSVIIKSEADRPWAFYKVADIVAIPSRQESFPLVTLEAMASEKPLVCAEAGGIPEQLEDKEEALLVPVDDVSALSGALGRLVVEPKLGKSLASKARDRVQRDFSLESCLASHRTQILSRLKLS